MEPWESEDRDWREGLPWPQWMRPRDASSGADPGRKRGAGDTRDRVTDESDTRRFLALEVYRVPEAWVDEVVRVCLADLKR